MKIIRPFSALALTAAFAAPVWAATVPGFDGNTLPTNDDESTDRVPLGFGINFLGESYDGVFVNNNGNVTFDESLFDFTPFDLTSTERVIIAPFFADVDTRSADVDDSTGTVTYGQGSIDGRNAFGVNWDEVGYFAQNDDKTNTFQLLIVDRSDIGNGNFDFTFNYDSIEFETGDASNGEDGLGGDSARAGYSNGTREAGTFFEIEGSAVNGAFLDGGVNSLAATESFTFEVRNGSVVDPPVTPPVENHAIPTPSAVGLGLLGLLAGAARRRRTV